MNDYDVVTVGDVNIDLLVEGLEGNPECGHEAFVKNMFTDVGGGAAISAMGLASLGLKTGLCGALGDDIYSNFIRGLLKQRSVGTQLIKNITGKRAGLTISLYGNKDRSFITYQGTNANFDIGDPQIGDSIHARHVHVTGYCGKKEHRKYMDFVCKLRSRGITVSADVGWDSTGEWYKGIFEFISNLDVFFINKVEAQNYTKCWDVRYALDKLSNYCGNVAIKLGPEGAVSKWKGRAAKEPTYDSPVVDTTGAGDSFNAGYLYGYLSGASQDDCLKFGNACGTSSISKMGGTIAIKGEKALREFIATHKFNRT